MALGLKQVSVARLGVIATLAGGAAFWVITTLALAVHPLVGLVAVTVYVPATVAVAAAPEPVNPFGPDQLKVAPEVVEVPNRVMKVVLQVSWVTLLDVAIAKPVGGVVLPVTVTVAVAVQPEVGLVAVSV